MLELYNLVQECAPNIAPQTMLSIIKTESNNNPFVINDNTTKTTYFPKSKKEAVSVGYVLIKQKHSLDFGLTQVNIFNARKYHSTLNSLFDPCINIKLGAKILTDNFLRENAKSNDEQIALLKSFSRYNTGNPHSGFSNGYVEKVLKNAVFIKVSPSKEKQSD